MLADEVKHQASSKNRETSVMRQIVKMVAAIAILGQAQIADANCPKNKNAAMSYLSGARMTKQGFAGTGEALAFYADSRTMMGAPILSIIRTTGSYSTKLSFRISGNPEDFAGYWQSAYSRFPATTANCQRSGRICFSWSLPDNRKTKVGQLTGASLYKDIKSANYSHFDCIYAEQLATR